MASVKVPITGRDKLSLQRMVREYGREALFAEISGAPKRKRGRPRTSLRSIDVFAANVDEVIAERRRMGLRATIECALADIQQLEIIEGRPVSIPTLKKQYYRSRKAQVRPRDDH